MKFIVMKISHVEAESEQQAKEKVHYGITWSKDDYYYIIEDNNE